MIDVIISYLNGNGWAIAYGLTVLFFIHMGDDRGNDRQKSVCAALFFLWLINIFHTEITSNMTPVIFFAMGDFLLGLFILLTAGKNKWQRGIGAWFILMMVAHIAYWIHEPKTYQAAKIYWMIFTLLGWGQLIHVGTWYWKTARDNLSGSLFGGSSLGHGEKP